MDTDTPPPLPNTIFDNATVDPQPLARQEEATYVRIPEQHPPLPFPHPPDVGYVDIPPRYAYVMAATQPPASPDGVGQHWFRPRTGEAGALPF